MTKRTIWRALVLLVILFFITATAWLLSGCVSASSSTNAGSESDVKAKTQSSQETSSVDNVALTVSPTVITFLDKDGTPNAKIETGGASASTGSTSNQESKSLNDISASSKASAEGIAKAAANLTYVMIGIGALLVLGIGFWVYYHLLP